MLVNTLLFLILTRLVFTDSIKATLDYTDSIKAIVYNQVDPNDGSKGDVWFNTTGYVLADYGFSEIGDVGITSYSSFNYLRKVAELAGLAAHQGFHGDVVLLYYKFVYAGQYATTALDANSDMILDIAEQLSKSETITKHKETSLYDILTSSVSSDAVLKVYELAKSVDLEKSKKVSVKLSMNKASFELSSNVSIQSFADSVASYGGRVVTYGGSLVAYGGSVLASQMSNLYNKIVTIIFEYF